MAISQIFQKKFNNLLVILKEYGVLECQNDGNKLAVHAPILLQLLDEGTRKCRKASGENQEAVRRSSGLDTDQDTEKDKEQNTVKGISEKDRWNMQENPARKAAEEAALKIQKAMETKPGKGRVVKFLKAENDS